MWTIFLPKGDFGLGYPNWGGAEEGGGRGGIAWGKKGKDKGNLP